MSAAKNQGAQAATEVKVHSMVCVTAPPLSDDENGGHVHPSDPTWAWFAMVGAWRRPIAPGIHVDPESPPVRLWPECFNPSGEAVDTRLVQRLTARARHRQAVEGGSQAPIHAILQVPACARCGWQAEPSEGLMVPPPMDTRRWMAARLSPYATEVEPARLVESALVKLWGRLRRRAEDALPTLERKAASLHPECPADVAPLDLDDVLVDRDVEIHRRPTRSGRR